MDKELIRASNLTWQPPYGSFILGAMEFNAHAGQFIAIIGPNGSGKSSLIRLTAGIISPTGGSIHVLGRSPGEWHPQKRGKTMAYLAQIPERPFGFSVWDYTALGLFPHLGPFRSMQTADREWVGQEIEAWHLGNLVNRPVTGLSGGEFQRVRLARALVQNPRILLLDEPANHLDIGGKTDILTRLKKESANGRTVLAILHDLNDALLYADEVWLISEGRLVRVGPPGDVLRPEILETVYGIRLVPFKDEQGGLMLGSPASAGNCGCLC